MGREPVSFSDFVKQHLAELTPSMHAQVTNAAYFRNGVSDCILTDAEQNWIPKMRWREKLPEHQTQNKK